MMTTWRGWWWCCPSWSNRSVCFLSPSSPSLRYERPHDAGTCGDGGLCYTLFRKAPPAFGLFVSMGEPLSCTMGEISTAAQTVAFRADKTGTAGRRRRLFLSAAVYRCHPASRLRPLALREAELNRWRGVRHWPAGCWIAGPVAPCEERSARKIGEHRRMKKRQAFRLGLAILFLWTSLALAAPAAMAASRGALPGKFSLGRPICGSRIDLEKAASSPWETLKAFAPILRRTGAPDSKSLYVSAPVPDADSGAGAPAGECTDGALLDLVAAGGCGVLLWGSLLEEAQKLCEQVESWRGFLLGFLPSMPVSSRWEEGSDRQCGQWSAADGTLLSGSAGSGLRSAAAPLLSDAQHEPAASALNQPSAFSARASAVRSVRRWAGPENSGGSAGPAEGCGIPAGPLFAPYRPAFGGERSPSSADSQQCIGIHPRGDTALKSGLGLAALSVLGAEFVPLYLGLMIQLALLMGCSLLCSLTGISRCRALFDCFAEAVRCMARWWRFSSGWRRQG